LVAVDQARLALLLKRRFHPLTRRYGKPTRPPAAFNRIRPSSTNRGR